LFKKISLARWTGVGCDKEGRGKSFWSNIGGFADKVGTRVISGDGVQAGVRKRIIPRYKESVGRKEKLQEGKEKKNEARIARENGRQEGQKGILSGDCESQKEKGNWEKTSTGARGKASEWGRSREKLRDEANNKGGKERDFIGSAI